MDLIILDENLDSVAIIDTYNSLIWTDRYQEYGDFELCMGIDLSVLGFIKSGYYIWNRESEHTMIIEDFVINANSEDGNQVTVTGRSLESIVGRRIVWGMRTLSGNFQSEMKALIDENIINPSKPERKIDNFVFLESEDPTITDQSIETQYTGDNLYDVVASQCQERGIGFKVTLNAQKQFVFQFYAGVDRSYNQTKNPYVIFSPNFDNIADSTYTETKSDMKNVTLVGGEGEGSARRYTAVGNTSGLDRRELFTDARDVTSDLSDDITEAFDFSQYPSQAFNNTTKQFVTDTLFNSCMVNVKAYAGRTISISLPKYTGADGQTSKYATILVTAAKAYVSTLKAWERYDDNSETVSKGNLSTYELYLPDDAEYLYTSMYSQKAIDSDIYYGSLTDFECTIIKTSDDEYIRLLRQRGKENLSENKEVISFEGEAETNVMFKYGQDFFVGDIVQIADGYGHETTSRVQELIMSINEEGRQTYPTFSTIIPEDESTLLPEGYTLLEYIQSSGTQYINTQFAPNNYTRVVMDVDARTAGTYPFFGSRDTSSTNMFAFWMIDGTSVRYNYGASTTELTATVTGRVTIDANMATCKFGSAVLTELDSATFQCANNLMLFTAITAGTVDSRKISAKLYSCRIYDDGTLIRNYVPCTNPDGLNGLYDLVNEKFYPNSGTGDFVAGQKGVETA